MNLNDPATKRDLIELERRIDAKIEYTAQKIIDDITEVIVDLMHHIDARFRRLEVATGQPQGWIDPPKSLDAGRKSSK